MAGNKDSIGITTMTLFGTTSPEAVLSHFVPGGVRPNDFTQEVVLTIDLPK